MKYIATHIPSSSTSYYKSKRCQTGSMTSVTEKEPESRSAMDISVNEVESTTPNEKDGDSTSQLTTGSYLY
ncbi:hypothetical protein EB796_024039 [Bugula neritina]|uniref:Uncharacterized protein n=1 Tax=Bugula neritina TaxID=10212 RepID=A0A7J7IVR7_BUGNE|nr:hypothetical protein EB796_024039 [Bugula neritina]